MQSFLFSSAYISSLAESNIDRKVEVRSIEDIEVGVAVKAALIGVRFLKGLSKGKAQLEELACRGIFVLVDDQLLNRGVINAILKAKTVNFSALDSVVSLGADVDRIDGETGKHPLEIALSRSRGRSKSLTSLIRGGSSLSARSPRGEDSPLLFKAISTGDKQLVMNLIQQGADVTELDSEAMTCLERAAKHPKVFNALVETLDSSIVKSLAFCDDFGKFRGTLASVNEEQQGLLLRKVFPPRSASVFLLEQQLAVGAQVMIPVERWLKSKNLAEYLSACGVCPNVLSVLAKQYPEQAQLLCHEIRNRNLEAQQILACLAFMPPNVVLGHLSAFAKPSTHVLSFYNSYSAEWFRANEKEAPAPILAKLESSLELSVLLARRLNLIS